MALHTKLTKRLGIKARVVAASGDDALRTHVFDIARKSPWPARFTGRALANRFSRQRHGRETALAADATAKADYCEAFEAQDFDTAVVWGGEGVALIHAVEPAGVIVERLVAEAEAALARRFD